MGCACAVLVVSIVNPSCRRTSNRSSRGDGGSFWFHHAGERRPSIQHRTTQEAFRNLIYAITPIESPQSGPLSADTFPVGAVTPT
jgi:hypothetical protein